MSEHLVLVENTKLWKESYPNFRVISAKEYLGNPDYAARRGLRVINLCRSQRYLSIGYYCSLLAEARGHRVLPSVRTIQDLSRKSIYSLSTADLDRRLHRILKRRKHALESDEFELPIVFGHCPLKDLAPVARELFEIFPAPLLKVEFARQNGSWRIDAIRSLPLSQLPPEQEWLFLDCLQHYLSSRWRTGRGQRKYRYDLAILHNPEEQMSPSDGVALKKFVRAARKLGVNAELIEPKEYARIAEYDALFIRETTRIDHHTYRFAKKAAKSGMVVMDDPDSILKCTNKIFLAELLAGHRVATPKTVILRQDMQAEQVEQEIAYPIVIKIPDGAFSRGVVKVETRKELESTIKKLFKESDLLLAQEFTPTEFDWRVGVLNREPLYVCQYFMSKAHWQIVDHNTGGRPRQGGYKAWAVDDAPKKVVQTALKAANLIGDGLYGVDLKETAKGILVIEVNDNPSLDSDVEDQVLGDDLYHRIMAEFLRRLELQRSGGKG